MGDQPLKRPYGQFRGGHLQLGLLATVFYLLGHPTPYTSNFQTIDETTRAKAEVEVRVAGLEHDLAEYKAKWETEVQGHIITKESIPKVSRSDRNFPCQTLKIRNVSLVVMGS
jgi:hypothetical protein